MSNRSTWQKVIERFDPEAPAQNPAWRASRSRSPAKAIGDWLDIPVGIPRVLLTGTVGTGKTTELYRIAESRAAKEFVVFVDLERHFTDVVGDAPALQQIASWEVCFLMGVALLRAAKERLGFEFPKQHQKDLEQAWSKLATKSGTGDSDPKLDVMSLAKSMVVMASSAVPGAGAAVDAGLTLLKATTEAVKWSVRIGRTRNVLDDQEADVQTLLASVNTLIGLIQQRGTRVLFVIDGLDRIRELSRARELFLDSQLISQMACPMVVCGPFALRHHPSTAAIRGFHDVAPLVNEPVLNKGQPSQPGPGVAFLRELFEKRVSDLPNGTSLISDVRLQQLAYYSGGRARELVTFVRRLAELCWLADVPQATDDLVARVLDERRRHRETGLHKGHIGVLESVAKDPDHRLPADPLAQELLNYGTLLPYPNESEWYYPHPLLLMHLLKV
ncbi:MAG: hypothetical protein IPK82_17045 [Polyangiaceae bacterium]|nr:hypothetical protein [Polyangiaceae bacterium]